MKIHLFEVLTTLSYTMTKSKWIYWLMQLLGWGSVFSLGFIGDIATEGYVLDTTIYKGFISLAFAIVLTHVFRTILVKKNWLNAPLDKTTPLIILANIIIAITLTFFNKLIIRAFGGDVNYDFVAILFTTLFFFVLSLIWTVLYFSYHFLTKSRKQEMKNLQLESSQKESELINLKNQLNPHFMFNAMNSIRALIDDEPKQAKLSITQLANLLRNTLNLGRKELITFDEELKIVTDYLKLEKVRFEERLEYDLQIEEGLNQALVPPLIIQTLIENAIKHGISKKVNGGNVCLTIQKKEQNIWIEVTNDGVYDTTKTSIKSTGIGLENAKKRLSIIYGTNGKLTIQNKDDKVKTTITYPLNKLKQMI